MDQRQEPITLDVSEASIKTATVMIKTLSVNNRQMTQAIFRQLPETELFDEETLEMHGTIWGWVNYAPKESTEGRQFVFQRGKELCRGAVFVRDLIRLNRDRWPWPLDHDGHCYEQEARNLILARALDGTLQYDPKRNHKTGSYGRSQLTFTVLPRPFWGAHEVVIGQPGTDLGNIADQVLHAVSPNPRMLAHHLRLASPDELTAGQLAQGIEAARENLRQRLAVELLLPRFAPEHFEAALDRIDANMHTYVFEWNALMVQLRAVEQLFIAV